MLPALQSITRSLRSGTQTERIRGFRHFASPINPRPAIIRIQLPGSGTAAGVCVSSTPDAESSELIRQALFSENFWKPATDFHPAPVGVLRTPASREPRRRRDVI
jgi:hypothetical protein